MNSKLGLLSRLQDVGDVRAVRCLPRTAAHRNGAGLGQGMFGGSRARGMGLAECIGTNV